MKPILQLLTVFAITLAPLSAAEPSLAVKKIGAELPKFVHRNWIIVADSV